MLLKTNFLPRSLTMNNEMKLFSTDLESLKSILSSTLDESIFFNELGSYLKLALQSDNYLIYMAGTDLATARAIYTDKSANTDLEVATIAGHVIRSKRAYFSNDFARDPLFSGRANKLTRAELCAPIMYEGLVIATVHLQNRGEKQFTRNDVTSVLEILSGISDPIKNMQMYLSAKALNEILLKKLEMQENAIAGKLEVVVESNYQIKEGKIISLSEVMKNAIKLSDKLAAAGVNALISGPTGSGREMLARRIHCRSSRASRAFIVVDCSVLAEGALEVELFGRLENSIAGTAGQRGLFEVANNGTIVLRNIHAIPINLQNKLNRYLQDGTIVRAESFAQYSSNARILAISDKNLLDMVAAGTFSKALYNELATMIVNVPSLVERKVDIESLASYFLNENKSIDQMKSLSPDAVRLLAEYNWPGNLRELKSVMQRAYILSDGRIIEADHLADSVVILPEEDENKEVTDRANDASSVFVEMTLGDLERRHICQTLEYLAGNKTKAAKALGITVKTLYNKLHTYGLIASQEIQ